MKDKIKDLKLGIFVLTGTIFFIVILYTIGSKKNLFGSSIKLKAEFRNVNGLMEGNNVRFGGIDIGSIEKINIVTDSSVIVEMWIDKSAGRFIGKNYTASVGTDGLMGNRLINIHPEKFKGKTVSSGDELLTIHTPETEEMIRAFNSTGLNMKSITENLNAITIKLKENNALWEILGKKEIAINLEEFIKAVNTSGKKVINISTQLETYSYKLNDKKSFLSKLSEEELYNKITLVVDNLNSIEDSTHRLIKEYKTLAQKINHGKGTVAQLINDTSTITKINETLEQLKKSARVMEEDLEGLKSSILLKRYFKNKTQKK